MRKPTEKNICPAAVPVGGKAKHTVGDIQRHQRDKQVCRLRNKVCRSVFRRSKVACVKPHHEKHQQLRAECSDAHESGVRGKSLITIHAAASLLRGRRLLCRTAVIKACIISFLLLRCSENIFSHRRQARRQDIPKVNFHIVLLGSVDSVKRRILPPRDLLRAIRLQHCFELTVQRRFIGAVLQ